MHNGNLSIWTNTLISALLFTGCAQYIWMHPEHNDQARFNRDSYECERDMRQSGYYGGGLAGQLNAQGFAERCMVARGYYKVARNQASSRTPPKVAAAPAQTSEPVSTPQVQPVTPSQPTSVTSPTPSAPAATSLFAQLYLIRGRIVSNPPQTFRGTFSPDGKAEIFLAGNRRLFGNFESFPASESIRAKYTPSLVNPDSLKVPRGADLKGFAALSDGIGSEIECVYALNNSTSRGEGTCTDNQNNTYRLVFD